MSYVNYMKLIKSRSRVIKYPEQQQQQLPALQHKITDIQDC